MANGDRMLDASGNVILDDSGNVLLDDGAGCASCCNPVCTSCAASCVVTFAACEPNPGFTCSNEVTGGNFGGTFSLSPTTPPSGWECYWEYIAAYTTHQLIVYEATQDPDTLIWTCGAAICSTDHIVIGLLGNPGDGTASEYHLFAFLYASAPVIAGNEHMIFESGPVGTNFAPPDCPGVDCDPFCWTKTLDNAIVSPDGFGNPNHTQSENCGETGNDIFSNGIATITLSTP